MDMNEPTTPPEVDNGVPTETLVYIIGTHEVERFVYEQQAKKIKEQALSIMKQNAMLKAENDLFKKKATEPVPPPVESPELLQLRKVNESGDQRVKQLEIQVHTVALERDEAKKEFLRFAGLAKDLQGLLDEANQKNVVLVTEKAELVKERNDLITLVQKKKGRIKE